MTPLGAAAVPAGGLRWPFEPGVLALTAAAGIVYGVGVRAAWRHAGSARVIGRRQVTAFYAGLAVSAVALASPLDTVADDLFWAHMLQHMLLIVVAGALFAIGAPVLATVWAVPRGPRMAIGRWWAHTRWAAVMAALTAPWAVWTWQTAATWIWHIPAPYEAALRHDALHAFEHLCFLGTATLFWWRLWQPVGRRRLSYGAGILYAGLAGVQGTALGAMLTLATTPWYPIHAAGERAWGWSALADQQAAGLIMWIPAGLAYIGAALWCAAQLVRADAPTPVASPEALG